MVNAWTIQAMAVTQPVVKRSHSFFSGKPYRRSIQSEYA